MTRTERGDPVNRRRCGAVRGRLGWATGFSRGKWCGVAAGRLSAGRVQSAALAMRAARDEKIRA